MTNTSTQQSWNASDYAQNSEAQFQWATELIGKLNLRGDETLLDIGCGDGKITAILSKLLKNGLAFGIDASQDMIEFAQKAHPATNYPNLTFLQMDARKIALGTTFDIAFSNAVLHWVDDHVAVLKGVYQHLKPQGKILFQMGGKGNVGELRLVIQEVMERPEWQPYYLDFSQNSNKYFYDTQDYLQWLPETGFEALRVELIPKDMQHLGKEGLKGWLRTTGFPYTDRLPEELKETFLNTVIDIYTQKVPLDAQGKTHVQMMRLEVEAIKI